MEFEMVKGSKKIAVVIPCYKVGKSILNVIHRIGEEVTKIYVVDDLCPDCSGVIVQKQCNDERVNIIYNKENLGVGGAVIRGYLAAIDDEMDIIVKIDGDGQMEPNLILSFITPIVEGHADYTKGNRFFDLDTLKDMPTTRLIGNTVLSFFTKLSSGYWNIFDPTNGFTAIHAKVAGSLPLEKISQRYFFETDMLFRLNIIRAVVVDVPMDSVYEDEKSSLKIHTIIVEFIFKHFRNFIKRIFYNYYLRDMSVASIELPLGVLLLFFGSLFGGYHWWISITQKTASTAGTVMLAALPIILGLQLILAFLGHDTREKPVIPFHRLRSKLSSKYNKLTYNEK